MPSKDTVGTWAWAELTNGRLRRRDRAELIRQGIGARLSELPRPWRRDSGHALNPLDLPDPPDSALARDAEELVREVSAPALYGHCLRTWAFSALFARRDRVAHDEEILFLACVLHDLGLTDAHNGHDATAGCFAVEGARAAHSWVTGHGEPESRALAVAEAISLHLNIDVGADQGAEAALLSKGVTLDVVGRRLGELPAEDVSEVNSRWPREGSGALLIDTTGQQARVRPDSRAALLHRLGFERLVKANPMDRASSELESQSPL